METIYIVVLGEMGAGKSSICTRFVQGFFMKFYDPTIEDMYRKIIDVDGKIYSLEILDTAGSSFFEIMREMYIKKGEGFIIVFSLISLVTFDKLEELYGQIQTIREGKVPMVMVGNKCDLKDLRVVSYHQAKELANSWDCPYIESSAKENINITCLFENVVRQIKVHPPTKKRKCTLF